jgi:hypothetical protein
MRSESLLPKSLVISAHAEAGTVGVGCGGGARDEARTVVVDEPAAQKVHACVCKWGMSNAHW